MRHPFTVSSASSAGKAARRAVAGSAKVLPFASLLLLCAIHLPQVYGQQAGGLTLNPQTINFGNQPFGTTSAAQTVTVTNPGDVTINISQIVSETGSNPEDFPQTNNCPAALAPDMSCQVSISFTPDSVGAKSAGVAIFDDSTPSQQQILVSGTGTGGILQVNPGNLKTIAGMGSSGYSGDGGPATAAQLNQPNGVAFDPSGNLYIADGNAAVVRKVDTAGNITTFAGTANTAGYTGDGGPATSATLHDPSGVTSDAAGNIYIQDTINNVIRKVDVHGVITTFAGTGTAGHAGDGGPATQAKFNENQGARFDKAGNLFVPQCNGASVRKIDTSGIITTVAGNFTEGYSGDGGPATSAELQCPSGVAIDAAGNLYIADYYNYAIRKVDTNGIITTIAGNGTPGFGGDGGQAASSTLNLPNDVVVDTVGNLYIADSGNNRVRKIDATGIITTAAGGLQNAGSAGVNTPLGVTLDTAGNVYFSDSGNSAVREIFPAGTTPFPVTAVGATPTVQTISLSNIGNVAIVIASSASFSVSGNTTDFTLTGGTCLAGKTLNTDGSTCTLQISFSPTAVGPRTFTVTVADNALNSPQSFTVTGTGAAAAPLLTWAATGNIVYGTPLSATQLDAVATGIGGASVAGTYVYSPAAGTVLGAGVQALSVVFTSTDPNYSTATAMVPLTVTQAGPAVTWAAPVSIAYGAPLSATQLDAAATGVGGTALPGTFVYTPAAGTVLAPGTQTLHVVFTPTDAVDYTAATGSVNILVTGPALNSITPAIAVSGSAATSITLTGSGFVAGSVVQVNGSAVATAYVSATTLTATIPAANLAQTGTLTVTVLDPAIGAVTGAQTFTVIAPPPAVTLTGPTTTPPGSQPSVALTIANPYPLDLTAVFTLTFAGAGSSPVDDPSIQFASGGRTYSYVVGANTTAVPPVQLQAGTVAGTITITVALTANGLNVTPTTLAPVVIVVPAVVPVVTSVTITRNSGQLTVVAHGFSNTREISVGSFHFTPVTGVTLTTTDLTVPGTAIFAAWFTSAASDAYGSTFTYTQIFNVSDDSTNIATVGVTLTNSVGASTEQTSQ